MKSVTASVEANIPDVLRQCPFRQRLAHGFGRDDITAVYDFVAQLLASRARFTERDTAAIINDLCINVLGGPKNREPGSIRGSTDRLLETAFPANPTSVSRDVAFHHLIPATGVTRAASLP